MSEYAIQAEGLVKRFGKTTALAGVDLSVRRGTVLGLLLLLASYLSFPSGAVLGLIISLLVVGRFLPAFLKTKKLMPAGLMSLFGIIGAVLCALTLGR